MPPRCANIRGLAPAWRRRDVAIISQLTLNFEEVKKCLICREEKPVSGFPKSKAHKGGLYSYCKQCRSEKRKPTFQAERREDRTLGVKQCTKCGVKKSLEEFSKQASQPDGHKCYCKECHRAICKGYHAKHRERMNAQMREHYRANPEPYKQRAAQAYQADPARAKARIKAWQQQYAERRREYSRKWSHANLKIIRERTRKRYAMRKGAATVPFTVAMLNAKRAFWGDKCWVCGGEPAAWDHVKPLAKGGAHMLANLRPICTVCNSRKGDKWPYPP